LLKNLNSESNFKQLLRVLVTKMAQARGSFIDLDSHITITVSAAMFAGVF
jgi:hypothetical protein